MIVKTPTLAEANTVKLLAYGLPVLMTDWMLEGLDPLACTLSELGGRKTLRADNCGESGVKRVVIKCLGSSLLHLGSH